MRINLIKLVFGLDDIDELLDGTNLLVEFLAFDEVVFRKFPDKVSVFHQL